MIFLVRVLWVLFLIYLICLNKIKFIMLYVCINVFSIKYKILIFFLKYVNMGDFIELFIYFFIYVLL